MLRLRELSADVEEGTCGRSKLNGGGLGTPPLAVVTRLLGLSPLLGCLRLDGRSAVEFSFSLGSEKVVGTKSFQQAAMPVPTGAAALAALAVAAVIIFSPHGEEGRK